MSMERKDATLRKTGVCGNIFPMFVGKLNRHLWKLSLGDGRP